MILAQRVESVITPITTGLATIEPSEAAQKVLSIEPQGSMGRSLLAELGYDTTQFATVADKRTLSAKESPAFYQLLHAVGQTPASQLVRLAKAGLDDYAARRRPTEASTERQRQEWKYIEKDRKHKRYSVVGLFGEGDKERGELVTLDAVVRRVVRIDASNDPVAQELGITGYYELEAFTEDSQNLPLVFVMHELPAGFPVGEAIRQPARLAGFFFKQWAYRTRKPSESGDKRQFAPLLVGRSPIPLAVPSVADANSGSAIGLIAAAGFLLAVLAIWRISRADKIYAQSTLARFRTAEPSTNFSHLETIASSTDPGSEER